MNRSYLYLFTSFFLVFLSANKAAAQASDSLQVVQAKWTQKTIAKGVVWKQAHFSNLFASEQEINFIEIDLKKHRKNIRLAADAKQLKTTSTFALENNALVAVNGGFFDTKNGGAVDFIKVDNQVINPTRKPSDRANAVFSISKKDIRIEAANPANTEEGTASSILLSGPLLVQHAERASLSKNPFNNNRHPRSAVGLSKKKLIFLVVDGRNSKAHGMNLNELASLMKWLGTNSAMNLDGGGSSTLYAKDATPNGVINYPCDNKLFDHEGQRDVANIIYLKK